MYVRLCIGNIYRAKEILITDKKYWYIFQGFLW